MQGPPEAALKAPLEQDQHQGEKKFLANTTEMGL